MLKAEVLKRDGVARQSLPHAPARSERRALPFDWSCRLAVGDTAGWQPALQCFRNCGPGAIGPKGEGSMSLYLHMESKKRFGPSGAQIFQAAFASGCGFGTCNRAFF